MTRKAIRCRRRPAASACRARWSRLASLAIQARDPERFDLLYRLVWRANAGERVLEKTDDPEVRRAQGLAFAVRAEAHRMRTLLRYLPVPEERSAPATSAGTSRRISCWRRTRN